MKWLSISKSLKTWKSWKKMKLPFCEIKLPANVLFSLSELFQKECWGRFKPTIGQLLKIIQACKFARLTFQRIFFSFYSDWQMQK